MGYLGRRIGLSQDQGDSNPGAAGGAVGGGLLDLLAHGYFERQGDIYNVPGGADPAGLVASGGVVSDYVSGSDVYRAHVFTSSGALNVTALSTDSSLPDTVDYLLVGGGGGTRSTTSNRAAGSGAGGFLAGTGAPVSVSSYAIVVGGGGAGGGTASNNGASTTALSKTAFGGGGGGGNDAPPDSIGKNGGSGGGGWYVNGPAAGGFGLNPSTPAPVIAAFPGFTPGTTQGNPGSPGFGGPEYGGSGGGAGGAGGRGNSGGAGAPNVYAYGPTNPITYAAGGASSDYPSTNRTANGTSALGNGGSGEGSGGSGTVIVRYKIAQLTATAKATGGAISFYNGKTIHTFTNSGDFTVTDGSAVAISYVAVAGGGSGSGTASQAGGGGGAGGLVTNIPGFMPVSQPAVNISPGSPNKATVTIGGGANSLPAAPGIGAKGTNTTLVCSPSSLNITATGGGFGGVSSPGGSNPIENGGPGGSGGGGAESTGAAGSGAPASQGSAGGTGSGTAGSTENSGGGGGGAGAVGSNAPGNANGGAGGVGKQLPAIFQDPVSRVGTPGPSGTYWIAGGGGGGTTTPGPGGGAGGAGGSGGGGAGGTEPGPSGGSNGFANTGGGGGSAENGGYSGGSGIVLIAYPS